MGYGGRGTRNPPWQFLPNLPKGEAATSEIWPFEWSPNLNIAFSSGKQKGGTRIAREFDLNSVARKKGKLAVMDYVRL